MTEKRKPLIPLADLYATEATKATDGEFTLADLYALKEQLEKLPPPPRRVRLTPAEAAVMQRPPWTLGKASLWHVPVEVVDPIIIAVDGRTVDR
jgi:hypothetical protein